MHCCPFLCWQPKVQGRFDKGCRWSTCNSRDTFCNQGSRYTMLCLCTRGQRGNGTRCTRCDPLFTVSGDSQLVHTPDGEYWFPVHGTQPSPALLGPCPTRQVTSSNLVLDDQRILSFGNKDTSAATPRQVWRPGYGLYYVQLYTFWIHYYRYYVHTV
jgi:hypothetical protein